MKHTPVSESESPARRSPATAQLLEEVDLSLAHLVVVSGTAGAGYEVTLQCFWVDAAVAGSGSVIRGSVPPCAVVSECRDCTGYLPTTERFEMHGVAHTVSASRAVVLHEDLCGLALVDETTADPETGRPRWVEQLARAQGPGIYLVFPAVDAGGNLVGVDPIRVDDTE